MWSCDGTANQGWYFTSGGEIENAGDQLCISAGSTDASSLANYTPVYMEPCASGNSQAESFDFMSLAGGYTALANADSIPFFGYTVLSSLGNSSNGAPVEWYAWDGSNNQQWAT